MASPDGYNSPIDWRITRNPAPVQDKSSQQNFKDIYDFAFATISGLVKYAGIGTLDIALWPLLTPTQTLFTQNTNKLYVIASVAIPAGHYVSLFNNAGVLNAKLSNAAPATVQADGYAPSAIALGAVGEVILETGLNTVVGSGLTIGQRYWLGNAGAVRTTPDVAVGHMEQYLGIALTVNSLWTVIGPAIQH